MDKTAEQVLEWIDSHRDDVVQLTSELIRIPSVSGKEGANDYYKQMAALLKDLLSQKGIESQVSAKEGGGTNFVATMKGTGNGPVLAMGGHYDVVDASEPDWITAGGFVPEIIDGRLYGRGSADMKGGLAACTLAMLALKESGVTLNGDVQLVATVDEEIGGPYGMDHLVNDGIIQPDFFINAEQTDMDIIVAFKGCAWMEVTVKGVTAHGSKPELGVNAVVKAAKVITRLEERGVKFEKDPLLGNGSLSIGTIKGGTGVNVVPDECVFTIDGRFVQGQTYEGVIAEIRALFQEMMAEDSDLDVSVEFISRCTNAALIPTDSSLVSALKESEKTVLGKDAVLSGFIAAGDNSLFLKKGVPALMCGPGSLKHIHKANEFVEVQDLVNAAKIYALTALKLCR